MAETASTNDVAFELAEAGCEEGTIVIAERQTEGRGRRGRPWFSVTGGSLTFSVVLRPRRARREWPELPLVTAGSVAETVRSLGVRDVILKAPNDVMTGGAKMAGVLLENRVPGPGPVVVAGIGINVNISRDQFPEEMREMATSLQILCGARRDREEIVEKVCESLDELYTIWEGQGLAAVRSRLEKRGIDFQDLPRPDPRG